MSKVFLWLFLLPPIEIFLWVWVAHFISGWWILLWTIGAFFFGMSLMVSSFRMLPKLQGAQGMQAFQFDSGTPELGKALTRALAGLLFVIPGLLTDAFAILLLLPPVQYAVQRLVLRFFAKRQAAMMAQMRKHGFSPDGFSAGGFTSDGFSSYGFRGTTVEGEARVVEPKPEKHIQLRQPANDD